MFEEVDALAERLLAADPDQDDPYWPTLDPDGTMVEELVLVQRLTSAAAAREMVILARLCQRAEAWGDRHDPAYQHNEAGPPELVAAETGPALHQTPMNASMRVQRAVEFTTRLPDTLRALARGEIDLGRALAIRDAVDPLTDDQANQVQQKVLPKAGTQTAGELRAALRKAVITVDRKGAEQRRQAAVKGRGLTRYQDTDGMSVLRAVLSAADANEIYDLMDEAARSRATLQDH